MLIVSQVCSIQQLLFVSKHYSMHLLHDIEDFMKVSQAENFSITWQWFSVNFVVLVAAENSLQMKSYLGEQF